MQIETLTFVYNEQFLLPFYLKHYDWCDKLNIVYDIDSTDDTLKILKPNQKVNIFPFNFKDGMDDILKVQFINAVYKTLDCDVVINVDCDEFLFAGRKDIEKLSVNPIVNVKLYDVYRHKSECDLDINLTIKEQRRHGVFSALYNKPIIVRTGIDIYWLPGNHVVVGGTPVDCGLVGAHWAMADLSFAIERRVKNRSLRQSKVNLDNKLTIQHHNLTEAMVREQAQLHDQDDLLWPA